MKASRQQPLTAIAKFSLDCTFNFLNSFSVTEKILSRSRNSRLAAERWQ